MHKWILILTMIILLCGCSNNTKGQTAVVFENAATFPTEAVESFPLMEIGGEVVQRSHEELYTEFGKFYSAQTTEDKGDYLLSLSDFEARISYPLCAKTNGRHDSGDCGGGLV